MSRLCDCAKRPRRGFTLIELLIVIVILAVLAGLILLRLTDVDKSSKTTTAIANLRGVSGTMDTFRVASNGKIPDGFDSLLNSDGSLYSGTGDASVNPGMSSSGFLTTSTLTSTEMGGFARVGSYYAGGSGPAAWGVNVYDHDNTNANPNLSTEASTARPMTTSATGNNVAVVNPSSTQGGVIYRRFNLGTADTSFRVVAFGVGTRCSLVGNNSTGVSIGEAPVAADPSPNSHLAYNRPIALFWVNSQTGLAQSSDRLFPKYLGTVNSYGKTADDLRAFLKK